MPHAWEVTKRTNSLLVHYVLIFKSALTDLSCTMSLSELFFPQQMPPEVITMVIRMVRVKQSKVLSWKTKTIN